ncbi:hypothetical protein O9G_004913 [Rozella allomycis CSF55]|uniref:Tetratricopeptide repeat protein n=1 Tax=Rozella allomycis (strain CSF55) TaxID=988480 RepID=A0A075AMX0_ROZAC|nr:hypothetical protein O9G_004913 [Rozella allomycis CSF55]|eukprot:EPZ31061.1 hypothetical protein O9G_004913 [Rozella allomycis CSF55]
MSLKAELVQWNEAVISMDRGNLQEAIDLFIEIADCAKFNYNLGRLFFQQHEYEKAIGNILQ